MFDLPEVIAAPAKRSRGRTFEGRRARTALWLLLPTLLAILLVGGYPLFRTIYLSFTDFNINSDAEPHWVGLENYWNVTEDGINVGLLADPAWWNSVWNTLRITIASVSMETLLGLGFAQRRNLKEQRSRIDVGMIVRQEVECHRGYLCQQFVEGRRHLIRGTVFEHQRLHLADRPCVRASGGIRHAAEIVVVDGLSEVDCVCWVTYEVG